jgi:guanosine-3',5'-bis(diphosphate) 3'-pyrophosphohydrolase
MSTAPGIDAAVNRSELLSTALEMARRAHEGQVRNASGGRPYIDHPVAVAERLSERDYPDEVLAAALLHDVVEDSELEIEDVRQATGDRVAEIVGAMTDDDSVEEYAQRKRRHRVRVESADLEILAVYAADKLTNLSMLRDAYAADGEEVAEELKVPLDEKVAVWTEDLEMLGRKSDGDPRLADLGDELAEQLRSLARDRSRARPAR